MKISRLAWVLFGLFGFIGQLFAGSEDYRIAGILAFGEDEYSAIIESPDGEQQLTREGDYIEAVQIVLIEKDNVTLLFLDGERQMQLSSGDYIHQSIDGYLTDQNHSGDQIKNGVIASEINKELDKSLDVEVIKQVRGLETLRMLNPSARLVAVSDLVDHEANRETIDTIESGVDILRRAIQEKRDIRISVEGDPSILDFYVMHEQMH